MPDDEYRKYSAAQKMQLLKSQQAKLEVRAMPAHSQLKLKAYDKKMKKKRKKKVVQKKHRKSKLPIDGVESSSSSKSKQSLASTGGGSSAGITRSPTHKSDAKELVQKNEQEEALKWKRRTEYIYEAERISIKLKEIATDCEKDIELRLAMDDIASGMDTLKKAREEYYQFVQAQNDIFEKQIKLLDELHTTQTAELIEKVQRLSSTFKNIDAKLSVINTKLQKIAAQQAQKTPTQNFIEALSKLF